MIHVFPPTTVVGVILKSSHLGVIPLARHNMHVFPLVNVYLPMQAGGVGFHAANRRTRQGCLRSAWLDVAPRSHTSTWFVLPARVRLCCDAARGGSGGGGAASYSFFLCSFSLYFIVHIPLDILFTYIFFG